MAVKVKENLGCVPLVLSVFPRQTIGIGVVFGQEFWLLTGRIKVYFSTFDDTSATPLCLQIWHGCRASIGSQLWDYWGELCKMCFKSPKCDGIPPRRCDGSFEDGDEVLSERKWMISFNLFLLQGALPSWSKFATWRVGWSWWNGGTWSLFHPELVNSLYW